jgi:DNA sulfur modification protein DndD
VYLSKIHLHNWRSYGDAEFRFEKPSERKPLVLIGAMNGHGKTSFLFSLYLGLFGRFGLRYAEGFAGADENDTTFYRDAIRRFRRSNAPSDEPTSVELVFSPTSEEETPEIRLIRQWFFANNGTPRQGDGFETVAMFIDGKPQKLHGGTDSAVQRLERYLFRANVMPAFFFDGEQAQTLINNSGQDGMKKAVEVLFGTRVVDETLEEIKKFIQVSHSKLGGKRNADSQQVQLDEKTKRREALESSILNLEKRIRESEKKREALDVEQRTNREALAKMGGERRDDLEKIHQEVERATIDGRNAERQLADCTKRLGLGLALSRLATPITNRLQSEGAREQWEAVRDGTIERRDEVLEIALPNPHTTDPLLGQLSHECWNLLYERFLAAIERIYSPPPFGCASEYLLGHVKGESRDRLAVLLSQVKGQNVTEIKTRARRVSETRDRKYDAEQRLSRVRELPTEVEEISNRLTEIGEQISECSRELGALENESKKLKAELKDISAAIGALQENLAKLGPEQKRIAVAERVRAVLTEMSDQLKPITVQRLQDTISSHFVRIADKRYSKGSIVFPESGAPVLKRKDHPDALIEMMSGFERRSFGVAFSLALAEITKKRVPLVIDTPLGNADKEYRRRLLRSLMNVDLDQIIILTHDAEVAGELFEEIEGKVKQTFLVEYDRELQESRVLPGSYFDGVGK